MNEYNVRACGIFIDSQNHLNYGNVTIKGNTFEEARENWFQEQLKVGIRMTMIELGWYSITFFDLVNDDTILTNQKNKYTNFHQDK